MSYIQRNRPILFIDFYKTLNHDVYWRSLPLPYRVRIQELLFTKDTALVNDWMRGKYTAEYINKMLALELNIPYEDLWNIFIQDCETMKVSEGVLEIINQLRKKYVAMLITGNMDSFTRFTQPALKLEKYFDVISNSFHEGMHKTDNDGELFLKYIRLYNSTIQDCISLDDSKNVYRVFSKLGGKAQLVTADQDITYHLKKLL